MRELKVMEKMMNKKSLLMGMLMGMLLFFILIFVPISGHAQVKTGSADLSWNANIETDLAGYKVYMGTASGVYGPPTDVAKTLTPLAPKFTINNLAEGTYFFVVTAYDTSGNESGFSNEVSKRVDVTPPAPPTGLAAIIRIIIAFLNRLFGLG